MTSLISDSEEEAATMTMAFPNTLALAAVIMGCATNSAPNAQPLVINDGSDSTSEASSDSGGQAASNQPRGTGRTLFDYMGDTKANEVALTTPEVFDRSLTIVKGRVGSVAEGRNIDLVALPGHPTAMAVVEIVVEAAFKGDVGDSAYFEFIRGGASAEDLGRNLPEEELIAFLGRSDLFDETVERADDDSRGLPPGQPLFRLTTQRGLIVNSAGAAVQPLEPEDLLFPQAKSFAEVEQLVLETAAASP